MTGGGHLAPDDYEQRLEALRKLVAPRRLIRTPWGWECYTPGRHDAVQAPTLDELEEKLKLPAGDDGDAATPPGLMPPAGP